MKRDGLILVGILALGVLVSGIIFYDNVFNEDVSLSPYWGSKNYCSQVAGYNALTGVKDGSLTDFGVSDAEILKCYDFVKNDAESYQDAIDYEFDYYGYGNCGKYLCSLYWLNQEIGRTSTIEKRCAREISIDSLGSYCDGQRQGCSGVNWGFNKCQYFTERMFEGYDYLRNGITNNLDEAKLTGVSYSGFNVIEFETAFTENPLPSNQGTSLSIVLRKGDSVLWKDTPLEIHSTCINVNGQSRGQTSIIGLYPGAVAKSTIYITGNCDQATYYSEDLSNLKKLKIQLNGGKLRVETLGKSVNFVYPPGLYSSDNLRLHFTQQGSSGLKKTIVRDLP